MPKPAEAAEALLVEQALATARTLLTTAEPVKAYRFLTEGASQAAIEHPRVIAFAASLRKQIDQAFTDDAYIERYAGYTNESQNPQEPFTDVGLLRLPRAHVALAEVRRIASQRTDAVEVLGIGCGDCTLEKEMLTHNPNVRVYVSELLSVASKATTALSAAFPGRVFTAGRFDVGDSEFTGYGERFDVITCLEVLEHVAEPQRLLHNIRDTLRPGGVVVLSTPNLLSWIESRHAEKFGEGNWYHHLRAYTPKSLAEAFLAAGLLPTILLEPGGTLVVSATILTGEQMGWGRCVESHDKDRFLREVSGAEPMPVGPGGVLRSRVVAQHNLGTLVVARGVLLEQA